MYTVGLHSISFSMYCTTRKMQKNGVSVYLCKFSMVEYYASENVTPGDCETQAIPLTGSR